MLCKLSLVQDKSSAVADPRVWPGTQLAAGPSGKCSPKPRQGSRRCSQSGLGGAVSQSWPTWLYWLNPEICLEFPYSQIPDTVVRLAATERESWMSDRNCGTWAFERPKPARECEQSAANPVLRVSVGRGRNQCVWETARGVRMRGKLCPSKIDVDERDVRSALWIVLWGRDSNAAVCARWAIVWGEIVYESVCECVYYCLSVDHCRGG